MKMSRRELSIDMVIHRGIFKNNQITFFPCFTFIPKAGLVFTVQGKSVIWLLKRINNYMNEKVSSRALN